MPPFAGQKRPNPAITARKRLHPAPWDSVFLVSQNWIFTFAKLRQKTPVLGHFRHPEKKVSADRNP